jgi:hypothetical protein
MDLLSPMRAGASWLELRRLVLVGILNKPWGNERQKGESRLLGRQAK